MSAIFNAKVLYCNAIRSSGIHPVFCCAAIARGDIFYGSNDRRRVTAIECHPIIKYILDRQKFTASVVGDSHIVSTMNFHHRRKVFGRTEIEVVHINGTGNRSNSGYPIAELTGQFIAHETTITHSRAVDALLINIVRGNYRVQQVAEKSYIIHSGTKRSEGVPELKAYEILGPVGENNEKVGSVGNGPELAVKDLLKSGRAVTMQVIYHRHSFGAIVSGRYIKGVVPVLTTRPNAVENSGLRVYQAGRKEQRE